MNPPTPTTDPVQAARAQRDEAQRALALAEAALQRAEEEEERPTVTHGGVMYRLSADGKTIERRYSHGYDLYDHADYIAALASLLPRVPVEVTDAMTDKAWDVYSSCPTFSQRIAMRAALEAVAAQLAPPATTPALGEPQWWAAQDTNGWICLPVRNRADVVGACDWLTEHCGEGNPHRIVALVEVPTDDDEQQEAKGS